MIGNNQIQTFKQSQRINTKQIQFLNFLFLNQLELNQRIQNELLENPFLEITENSSESELPEGENENFSDDITGEMRLDEVYSRETLEDDSPQYSLKDNNASGNDWQDLRLQRITENEDLLENLFDQIKYKNLTEQELEIAHFIIHSADEKGFLNTTISEFTDNLCFATGKFFEENTILKVKEILNSCEPEGFGSFDLRDYLLYMVQNNCDEPIRSITLTVVERRFDYLSHAQWDKIANAENLSQEIIYQIQEVFGKIKPYPTQGFSVSWGPQNQNIQPDYEIILENGKLKGEIVSQQKFNFKVNDNYAKSILAKSKGESKAYVEEKMKSAYWLIDAIQQREETMSKVINSIVMLQKEFLVSGDFSKLRPMILKDIAAYIDMDISTVSRVTSNKFAQSPMGLINLKELFTEAIYLDDGSRKSNKEVQQMVVQLIDKEDKENPMSDFELQKALQKEGINLTRRTITKYRMLESIPSSLERKIIS